MSKINITSIGMHDVADYVQSTAKPNKHFMIVDPTSYIKYESLTQQASITIFNSIKTQSTLFHLIYRTVDFCFKTAAEALNKVEYVIMVVNTVDMDAKKISDYKPVSDAAECNLPISFVIISIGENNGKTKEANGNKA